MCIHLTGYHGILSLNNKNDNNALSFAKQNIEILDKAL